MNKLKLFVAATAALTMTFAAQAAKTAKAVLSADKTTLRFFYDEESYGTKKDVDWFSVAEAEAIDPDYEDVPWYGCNGTVTRVVFDYTFKDYKPTRCGSWFYGFTYLASVEGLKYLDTSLVDNMAYMFYGCVSLKSLDEITGFDTTNVETMYNMFCMCTKLTSLYLWSFDTSKVTDMAGMFKNCEALATIFASDTFVTDGVTSSGGMFYGCPKLVGGYGSYTFSNDDKTYARIDKADQPGRFTAIPVQFVYTIEDSLAKITHILPNGATEVVIPAKLDGYTVNEIEPSACEGCKSLKSLTIPKSVSTIGAYAFRNCPSLASVCFDGRRAPICGFDPFTGAASGAKVYVNTDAQDFGAAGSSWQGLTVVHRTDIVYEYEVTDGKVRISGVHPNGNTELVIPSMIDGLPVTEFSNDAFNGGPEWHNDTTNITSVVIPEGVKTISGNTFKSCQSLVSVTIPSSVSLIRASAFEGCSSLTSVYFCRGYAPSCETNVFSGVASGAKAYVSRDADGFGAEGSKWQGLRVAYRTDVVYECSVLNCVATITEVHPNGHTELIVPSTISGFPVKEIGSWAFLNLTNITSVMIPDGVTAINVGAFASCKSLKSLNIPASVAEIQDTAFNRCYSLALTIDPGNTHFCITNGLLCDKSVSRVINCLGTPVAVTIPKSVTAIGKEAFLGERTLHAVTFNGNAPTCGSKAFSGADFAAKAYVSSSATGFGDEGSEWNGLTVVKGGRFLTETVGGVTYFCTVTDGQVTIDRVTVGSETEIAIPSALGGYPVTKLGDRAFAKDSNDTVNIKSVTIPKGVTTIGREAFYGCENLKSVTIPESVSTIEFQAFMNCYSLASVTIPEGVTTIGEYAFAFCSSLASVSIPESVTTIGGVAFQACESLTKVTIPPKVTAIGRYTFAYCKSLTTVTIPKGVTKIEKYAFNKCTSLSSVYFEGNAPTLSDYVFSGIVPGAKAYVKKGSTGWGVTIPGTWNGLAIDYYDGKDEPGEDDPDGPSPKPIPTLFDSVMPAAVTLTKAATYNGFLGERSLGGTFTLSVKKPARGAASGKATLTKIDPATGKKVKTTGTVNLATGRGEGDLAGLVLNARGLGGTFEGFKVQGAVDAGKAKDAATIDYLNTYNKTAYAFVLEDSVGERAMLTATFSKKGKVKIAGTVAGKKISGSAYMSVGDRCAVPFVYAKKSAAISFVLWFDKATKKLTDVSGFGDGVEVVACGLAEPPALGVYKVTLAKADVIASVPDAIGATPLTVTTEFTGKKFDAGKAAKVAYKGGVLTVDTAKGPNVSGLSLKYSKGALSGSFTVYAVDTARNKLVKNKFTVSGLVIDGVGYAVGLNKKLPSIPFKLK